jgi:hypothetical protein
MDLDPDRKQHEGAGRGLASGRWKSRGTIRSPEPGGAGRGLASGLWKGALVAGAAALSIAASWQRWIDPFVDSGRELELPARLAAGERLYRDVIFYYGPAGPWLQSLAQRACGSPCRSWLPLEIACLALAAAIFFLLYRLAAAAGGSGPALAATAIAAAFCLGAPHGGAFIFPYSASSLYGLAGGLLALAASLRPPGWRRRALVAAGLALALTSRIEIGAATLLILLVAALRSRRAGSVLPAGAVAPDPAAAAGPAAPATTDAAAPYPAAAGTAEPGLADPSPAGDAEGASDAASPLLPALGDAALGMAVAAVVYAAAFSGIPWRLLVEQGPLTHLLAMPPEWRGFYGGVAGVAHFDRSWPLLARGLALDALLLAACAWLPSAGRVAAWRGTAARLLSWAGAACVVAAVATYGWWGGALHCRWSGITEQLPPVLFPLPLLAGAAAVAALRHPLDRRGRARFALFALAAALAARVPLSLRVGPPMLAYCALPLPPLLAAAAVLAGDLLAPRLRDPRRFRLRLAALAVGLAALYLVRLGAVGRGPHIVRLDTPAGSLRLPWKEAIAIDGTLGYLAANAHPGDTLASFPEAGFFNFITGLRNPLREDEIFPGVLDAGREAEAIDRLLAGRTRFVLLANRPTPEFGPRAFGRDYAAGLWSAVEDHYSLAASFGNAPEWAEIGAHRFFIRIYVLDLQPMPAATPGGPAVGAGPAVSGTPGGGRTAPRSE